MPSSQAKCDAQRLMAKATLETSEALCSVVGPGGSLWTHRATGRGRFAASFRISLVSEARLMEILAGQAHGGKLSDEDHFVMYEAIRASVASKALVEE